MVSDAARLAHDLFRAAEEKYISHKQDGCGNVQPNPLVTLCWYHQEPAVDEQEVKVLMKYFGDFLNFADFFQPGSAASQTTSYQNQFGCAGIAP